MSSTDKNPKRSVPPKGRIHREDWATVSLLELFHYACAQDTASNVDSYSVYGLDENHLYGTVHAQGKEAMDANSKVTATIYTHVTKKLSIDELISQAKEEKLRKRTFQLDPPKVPSKASKDPA